MLRLLSTFNSALGQKLQRLLTACLCILLTACAQGKAHNNKHTTSSDRAPKTAVVSEPGTIPSTLEPSDLEKTAPDQSTLEQRWIVSAPEAKQLLEQGATLLDARGNRLGNGLFSRRLEGAINVNWRDFSQQSSNSVRGNLLTDEAQLTQQLQTLGISNDKPVIVFANPPSGWGEDGRIVWMLRTLGHSQAVMVDGGFQALVAENVPIQQGRATEPTPGDFVVNRIDEWSISQNTLREQLEVETLTETPVNNITDNLVIIDTRERREFEGQTPYGEQRGGHIPGAVHLYFKDLLEAEGTLLPHTALLEELESRGITPDKQIVVYCTGGVRSGWLAAVLVTLGFPVQNYAGSLWEWSARDASRYPLETTVR